MIARNVSTALFCTTLGLLPFSGCQCIDDTGFSGITDPPPEPQPEPPPPPPKYPLKSGDVLEFNGVGGRTEPCETEGRCERTMKSSYTIQDVYLDETSNTWTVDAEFLFELTVGYIESGAISRLFVSRVAPFADIEEGGSLAGAADFRADGAPTDGITANQFPFFHFEPEYATKEDSAFRVAAAAFQTRILEIDPDADIDNQAAGAKFQAYFKDELGVNPMLHKLRVDLHPFGFVCGWDERLIPWMDGMPRNEGAFAQASGIPMAAVFPGQIKLVRDDTRYTCSCFTKKCKQTTDQNVCLNPKDPDAAPLPCVCLDDPTAEGCP